MEYSKKLLPQFGQYRDRWHPLYIMAEVLQHMVDGRMDHAAAHLVLGMQAIHQASPDQGTWSSAWLLLPTADPLARPVFGGSEQQMAEIANYRRALKDLQTKHEKKEADGDRPSEAHDESGAKAKGRGRRQKEEK